MKFIITSAVFLIASFQFIGAEAVSFDEVSKKCTVENGIDESTDPDDRKFMCYETCFYREFGIVDKDGNLDLEEFQKFMSRTYTDDEKKAIDDCGRKHRNSDVCKQVTDIQSCIYNST